VATTVDGPQVNVPTCATVTTNAPAGALSVFATVKLVAWRSERSDRDRS
jgi:hypothetical protein